ncbi:TPA: SPI-1 type III secretion system protein SpaN [Salmonella enterica]|nr:SPI-1 type III secretion system protein SpaN [Salmonella enterica]
MGDLSPVSSSGNILLPQQEEAGGLSEALKKALEKHKTEYADDKKEREYGDAFFMHKEAALPPLLAALRHGTPVKAEHGDGSASRQHHPVKGELRIAEKLLKVTSEKAVTLVSDGTKIEKTAALLSSQKIQGEGVSSKKVSADLNGAQDISEVADNANQIAGDNVKTLSGDNKVVAGDGGHKEGAPLAREIAIPQSAANKSGKTEDKDHKKTREVSQLPLQPTTLSDRNQLSGGDENKPVAAQSRPVMSILPTSDGVKGEDNSLTYRFQRWGNDYSVNIQARQAGEFSLIPSNTQVEHRLHEQWQNGNPHRWHLTRDDQQNPQQQQHRQQSGEEDDA